MDFLGAHILNADIMGSRSLLTASSLAGAGVSIVVVVVEVVGSKVSCAPPNFVDGDFFGICCWCLCVWT